MYMYTCQQLYTCQQFIRNDAFHGYSFPQPKAQPVLLKWGIQWLLIITTNSPRLVRKMKDTCWSLHRRNYEVCPIPWASVFKLHVCQTYQHSLVRIPDLAELVGVRGAGRRVGVIGFGFLQVCLLHLLITTVLLNSKQGVAVLDTCRLA